MSLILAAAGMAANLAGSLIKDKDVVNTRQVYTPSQTSFQTTGLFNNSIGDIGEQTITDTTTEVSDKKKGLMAAGSVLSMASSVGGMTGGRKEKFTNDDKTLT